MDGTNSTTAWTIAGVVALVVIIAGGWLISREKSGTSNDMASTTETVATATNKGDSGSSMSAATSDTKTPTPSVVAGGETVTVSDQAAGSVVNIDSAKLTKPSWVAIVGTNGWVRGAHWFNSSVENVSIELVKPTIAGESYQAVIYVDDGDKKFSLHAGDTLVTSSEGAPVSSTFKTQ